MLYLFLFFIARTAWSGLHAGGAAKEKEARMAMLTISDPARSGRQPGERLAAPAGATVGREPGNTLVLREDTISARHAVFRHERGRWLLEDLDSTNGTWVNGQPLHGTVRLSKGDEVRFGHVALRFEG